MSWLSPRRPKMAPRSTLVMATHALDTVGLPVLLNETLVKVNYTLATHALDTVGFPALLNETLVKVNYTFKPKYVVYARGYGMGMVEYVARIYLERMEMGFEPFRFEAVGTSPEMAIQEVAHGALAQLRYELRELWEDPFTYLPVQGPEDPFPRFVSIPVEVPLLERRMAETISAYERVYRSMMWELDETRRRLLHLQTKAEPYM
ncbi:unnamed protein product [Urochloa decumbens]|uniref:Uncharacterized protein n=1 Tax=Urochloa decumbens TaxID=240449 RepID=A0ABC9ACF0_9POAL